MEDENEAKAYKVENLGDDELKQPESKHNPLLIEEIEVTPKDDDSD